MCLKVQEALVSIKLTLFVESFGYKIRRFVVSTYLVKCKRTFTGFGPRFEITLGLRGAADELVPYYIGLFVKRSFFLFSHLYLTNTQPRLVATEYV